MPRRGLYPENTFIKFSDVQINLDDAALGPDRLQQWRNQRLQRFARVIATMPQKHILDGLLAQRRCASITTLRNRQLYRTRSKPQ